MEEDIMILESECYYLEELGYLKENNHFIRFNQALKNLIKGYKLEKLKNVLDEQSLKETLEDYIPKSKIREKIEPVIDELEKDGFVGYADELRDVLQELLEEEVMEEDIKILEEVKRPTLATGFKRQTKILQALENLIKGYKELEERNIYLVNERKKLEELLFMSNENYIEKSKIREKIEKTRFYIPEYQGEFVAIEDLENLLEEEV
jgi:hypothetical protein